MSDPGRAPMESTFSGRRSSRSSNFELDGGAAAGAQNRHTPQSGGGFQLPAHGGSRNGPRQGSVPQSPASALRNNNRCDSLVSGRTIGSPLSNSMRGSTRRTGPPTPQTHYHHGSAVIRRGSDNNTSGDAQVLSAPQTPGHSGDLGSDGGDDERSCGLLQLLFGDLREEGDDFDTILRKIVVSVGVPLVIFPIAFAVYMATQVALNGITAGNITSLIVMFVFPLVWIPTYMYVRMTKDTPDALMDAWLIITTSSTGLLSICLPEYPVSLLAFYLAAISIMCHTPLMYLELALGGVVYLLSAMNHAFMAGGVSDVDLWALPNPYRGTVLERVAYHVTCFGIGLIIIAALMMQMREHVRQIAAAKEAAEMSRQVAGELQRYDTEAVQLTLDHYSRKGLADTHLIETFMAIVDNLELFRPHLPNWMMNALNGEGGDLDDPDLMADVQSALSRTMSVASMKSMRIDGMMNRERSRNGSIVGRLRSSDLTSEGTGSEFSVHFQGANNELLVKDSKNPRRNGSFLKKAVEPSPGGGLVTSVGPKPHKGKVTYALLEVVTSNDLGLKRFESIGSRFVDRVHQGAAETHAAVHTFVGDTVHASWNTAGRIALPEVKACRFVASLLKDSGDSAVSVQGCIMTGEARSYLAGTKQQALTVSFKWRDALQAAVVHSRQQNVVYMCPDTHRAAKNDMVTRGVAAIRVRALTDDVTDGFNPTGFAAGNDSVNNLAPPDVFNSTPSGSTGAPLSPMSDGTPQHQLPPQSSSRLSGGASPAAAVARRSQVIKLFQLFRERDEVELSADEWMYVVDATENEKGNADGSTLARCLRGEFTKALDEVTTALNLQRAKEKEIAAAMRDPTADIEAAWVDDEEDEDYNMDDPLVAAMMHLKRRIEHCIKTRARADGFPEDMTAYF